MVCVCFNKMFLKVTQKLKKREGISPNIQSQNFFFLPTRSTKIKETENSLLMRGWFGNRLLTNGGLEQCFKWEFGNIFYNFKYAFPLSQQYNFQRFILQTLYKNTCMKKKNTCMVYRMKGFSLQSSEGEEPMAVSKIVKQITMLPQTRIRYQHSFPYALPSLPLWLSSQLGPVCQVSSLFNFSKHGTSK